MNVLILNGSFNKNGMTYRILDRVIKSFEEKKYKINIVDVYSLSISHCIGCLKCEKTGECIFSDLDYIYDLIDGADIIVLSSPVYFASFSSPLKILIDRLQVMYARNYVLKNQNLFTKKGIFVFTAGRSNKNMVDAVILQAKYVFLSLNARLIQTIYQLNTDQNKNIEDEVLFKANNISNII